MELEGKFRRSMRHPLAGGSEWSLHSGPEENAGIRNLPARARLVNIPHPARLYNAGTGRLFAPMTRHHFIRVIRRKRVNCRPLHRSVSEK